MIKSWFSLCSKEKPDIRVFWQEHFRRIMDYKKYNFNTDPLCQLATRYHWKSLYSYYSLLPHF